MRGGRRTAGTAPAWLQRDRRVAEGSFLQLHVGVEVDLRGLDRLVAKPERDHRQSHSLLATSPQPPRRAPPSRADRSRRTRFATRRQWISYGAELTR